MFFEPDNLYQNSESKFGLCVAVCVGLNLDTVQVTLFDFIMLWNVGGFFSIYTRLTNSCVKLHAGYT